MPTNFLDSRQTVCFVELDDQVSFDTFVDSSTTRHFSCDRIPFRVKFTIFVLNMKKQPTITSTVPIDSLATTSTVYQPVGSDDVELINISVDGENHEQPATKISWLQQSRAAILKHQTDQSGISNKQYLHRPMISLHILFIFLLIGQLILIVYMSLPGFVSANAGACTPAGNFQLLERAAIQDSSGQYQTLNHTPRYNPWTTDTAFQIDMSHGSFSFSTAKLIDIMWDVVRLRSCSIKR